MGEDLGSATPWLCDLRQAADLSEPSPYCEGVTGLVPNPSLEHPWPRSRRDRGTSTLGGWAWTLHLKHRGPVFIWLSDPLTFVSISRQFLFFKDFFLIWTTLKTLLHLLRCCFCCMACFFDYKACGILVPRSGIKPAPPALEGEVLALGPPGKSLQSVS